MSSLSRSSDTPIGRAEHVHVTFRCLRSFIGCRYSRRAGNAPPLLPSFSSHLHPPTRMHHTARPIPGLAEPIISSVQRLPLWPHLSQPEPGFVRFHHLASESAIATVSASARKPLRRHHLEAAGWRAPRLLPKRTGPAGSRASLPCSARRAMPFNTAEVSIFGCCISADRAIDP